MSITDVYTDEITTYREPLGRFVVERLDRLPEEHRAEMRINGIDPDNNWLLEWSFNDREDAFDMKAELDEQHEGFCRKFGYAPSRKYRVRDRGEDAPKFIERAAW